MASKTKNITILLVVSFIVSAIIACIYYYPCHKERLKWQQYFNRTTIGEPNKLVSNYFSSLQDNVQLTILDLGAGNGSDTAFLLGKGHIVYAVDFYDESIKKIEANIASKVGLKIIKSKFEDLDWDNLPKFDVIIAINSISFVEQKNFDNIWHSINDSLKPNGVIITRLFGNKIEWQNMNKMTLLDNKQIANLIYAFEIIENQEEFYHEGELTQHAFNLVLKNQIF